MTENWALFIESLMPSGLSNFFFFDGEKIAELAVEETSDQMKESIKMLLGVSVIDSLRSDLVRVTNKAEKLQSDVSESARIDKLREERNTILIQMAQAEQALACFLFSR